MSTETELSPALEEWDVFFLLLMVPLLRAQQARKDSDPEWVGTEALGKLCKRIGQLGPAALAQAWDREAAGRGLIEVRRGSDGAEVRMTALAQDLLATLADV